MNLIFHPDLNNHSQLTTKLLKLDVEWTTESVFCWYTSKETIATCSDFSFTLFLSLCSVSSKRKSRSYTWRGWSSFHFGSIKIQSCNKVKALRNCSSITTALMAIILLCMFYMKKTFSSGISCLLESTVHEIRVKYVGFSVCQIPSSAKIYTNFHTWNSPAPIWGGGGGKEDRKTGARN